MMSFYFKKIALIINKEDGRKLLEMIDMLMT